MRQLELTGQQFGRLTVMELANSHRGRSRWQCRCECGCHAVVLGWHLTKGKTKSCGCLRRETASITNAKKIIHGEGNARTAEYICWVSMKNRCLNSNRSDFYRYGGRGIRVCKRWLHSFENFLADMGRRPTPAHSIDRINNDGNYEPNNCRWATALEQRHNQRRVKLHGH